MQTIYTSEDVPNTITKSIFLAGPSLRPGQEKEMDSWRKDALKILEDKGFDGTVFCPENKGFGFPDSFDYDDQIEWEEKCLNIADCIVFWVPRDLSVDDKGTIKLAALTTNIEWGAWADSGKVVFGAPEEAEKVRYLKYYANKYNVPTGDTLTETLENAMEMIGEGAERTDGECFVPLFLWKTPSFQSWYQSHKKAGNRLDHAEVLWSFRPRYKDFVYAWVLKVDVFITAENRHKTNEFVLTRTDISSICLWHPTTAGADSWEDIEVVIVKEFRSPANTEDGFVRELPGGSSSSPDEDPQEVAAEEVFEETGFHLKSERLKSHGARQLAGTFSAHKSHLYSVELDDREIEWFKSRKDIAHGNVEDSERTFIEVHTISDLLENNEVDWTTLGQILSVIRQ